MRLSRQTPPPLGRTECLDGMNLRYVTPLSEDRPIEGSHQRQRRQHYSDECVFSLIFICFGDTVLM